MDDTNMCEREALREAWAWGTDWRGAVSQLQSVGEAFSELQGQHFRDCHPVLLAAPSALEPMGNDHSPGEDLLPL